MIISFHSRPFLQHFQNQTRIFEYNGSVFNWLCRCDYLFQILTDVVDCVCFKLNTFAYAFLCSQWKSGKCLCWGNHALFMFLFSVFLLYYISNMLVFSRSIGSILDRLVIFSHRYQQTCYSICLIINSTNRKLFNSILVV